MNGTIREIVSFAGEGEADERRIRKALQIACADEFVSELKQGFDTLLGERGTGLSEGQMQRIAIARALYSEAPILLLDEATSALDNITQKQVSEALDRMRCTRIVIAHRLSTIRHCDRILVLDQGKIVEDGTYEQLMEKKGFFAELVERQQVGAK